VIIELLLLWLVVILCRNLFAPESVGLTSVLALFFILTTASYLVGEFESTVRANYGLTLRTQGAFGMAYVGYSLAHGLWSWCEPMTVRFWLALWVYLSLLAPLIGLGIRYLTRVPALLVTDINAAKVPLLRWWGFDCPEVVPIEDLAGWLAVNADGHGHIARYDFIVVDSSDPRTEHAVAGLSESYFIDFVGIPSFRWNNYLLGPHPRPVASYSLSGTTRRLKRVLDLVLAGVAILLLSPLYIGVSIAIKLTSPGPVFYRHKRLGRNMRPLGVLKFRTMFRDADRRLKSLLESDPALAREFAATFKLKNDPRVTPIGRFLRRYSIDELPQFFNILAGEMSFVGPRPIVEDEVKYYKDYSLLMFRVRPGATGLWQVSGRNDTSYESRVRLDTKYVQEWSLVEDLRIILRTPSAVLSRRGAY
jgi:lipopolysaccharide/colanic/teichoic acid biosynthesis glycosyltransferase